MTRHGEALLCALLGAAGACDNTPPPPELNRRPSFVRGEVLVNRLDGQGDDLLTGGLGQDGLAAAALPMAFADPTRPTAAELRRAAAFYQYRALKDVRARAGYGSLYGPAVPGRLGPGDARGRIAGREYLAYADDGSGQQNVTLLVQIPARFDAAHPCVVATASSGSRGAYGANGTAGEWGLKNGCAVAHTDKGTGNGVHDLDSDTVNRMDGTRGPAAAVGDAANFRARGSADQDLDVYRRAFPLRIAEKHAHSQQNPEARWGQHVLQAIEFAFYVLNLPENFGQATADGATRTITPASAIVIAAGVSNGGGAVLRAAEQDTADLIDGVVALEPNINPARAQQPFTIRQGDRAVAADAVGRPFLDYITYYALFQPCASAATQIAAGQDPAKGPPAMGGVVAGVPGRCGALKAAGLLSGATLAEQVREAQQRLDDYGALASSHLIAHPYQPLSLYVGNAMLYATAYGRFSVTDNLCGYSYAAVNTAGQPVAKAAPDLALDFAAASGAPPTNKTALIANREGAAGLSVSASPDEHLVGARCLRSLFTGTSGVLPGEGAPLGAAERAAAARVQAGAAEVRGSGDLQRRPALIVHGRDDALIPVNFSSRAYFGLNQRTEGPTSRLAYVEVLHANHLDAVNRTYNIDTQVPLLYYLDRALDRMYAHLASGVALPASQVVRTRPLAQTGGDAPSRANLPDLDDATACPIRFEGDVLDVPDCAP